MSETKITEKKVDEIILELLKGHSDEVIVDEEKFLDLLKHSLSLNTVEKKRVIDATPTLSQFQFDELAKVFTEEREKFRELATKHPDDIKRLVVKQKAEWLELWDIYKMEVEKKNVASKDEKKIDEIKKNLGI